MRPFFPRWTSAALLLACACSSVPKDSQRDDRSARTDGHVFGSCSGSCGEQSRSGTCWCDELCAEYEDCCDDKIAYCDDSGVDAGVADDAASAPDATADASAIDGGLVVLPSFLDLGGNSSAIAVDDIDADGWIDIAAIVGSGNVIRLVVAWGAPVDPWTERYQRLLTTFPAGLWPTRDWASNVLALGDWNGDGWVDVATWLGVALGDGGRILGWQSLPSSDAAGILPIALVEGNDGDLDLVRGMPSGQVERCTHAAGCESLPVNPLQGPVSELVVGDFDRDGDYDVLAASFWENPFRSVLWGSREGWQTTTTYDIHGVDLEVGDVDGDGHPDVVAQRIEHISDFPSYTDVWINRPDGFERNQTLYNHDNHNDAAAVVDIDADGCLDYLQIGVDIPAVGLRRGSCNGFLGDHDPTRDADVGWEQLPASPGIGVQCLDLNGDGPCEIVVRDSSHGLRIFAPAGDLL